MKRSRKPITRLRVLFSLILLLTLLITPFVDTVSATRSPNNNRTVPRNEQRTQQTRPRTLNEVIDSQPEPAQLPQRTLPMPAQPASTTLDDVAPYVYQYLFPQQQRGIEGQIVQDMVEINDLLGQVSQLNLSAEEQAQQWELLASKREQLRVNLRVLWNEWKRGPPPAQSTREVGRAVKLNDQTRTQVRAQLERLASTLDSLLSARAQGRLRTTDLARARALIKALAPRTEAATPLPSVPGVGNVELLAPTSITMDAPRVQATGQLIPPEVEVVAQPTGPAPQVGTPPTVPDPQLDGQPTLPNTQLNDQTSSTQSASSQASQPGNQNIAVQPISGEAAPVQVMAQTPPTAADLAATTDIQITQEIRDLAARLNNNPLEIYRYVRDNIDFHPYYGSWMGSTGTLWAKRGNNYDQASLLLALLRAANISSRYVTGKVIITGAQAQQWTGTQNLNAAATVLNNTISLGTVVTINGVDVQLDHVWVEAWLPYGAGRESGLDTQGSIWVPMDPSFKPRIYQPGIDVNGAGEFNYTNYLSRRQRYLPFEMYQDQVRTWLNTNQPSRSLADIGYTGPIRPTDHTVLSASPPYFLNSATTSFSTIADTMRVRATIRLQNSGGTQLLSTNVTLPGISTARLTLAYNTIDSVTVQPVLRQDGTTLVTGSNVALNDSNRLIFTITEPGRTASDTTYPVIKAGEYHALYFDVRQSSSRLVEERTQRLLNATANIGTAQENKDELLGELLHLALVKYNYRVDQSMEATEDIKKYVIGSLVRVGVTKAANAVQYLGALPFAVYPDKVVIDFKRNIVQLFPLDGAVNNTRDLSVMRMVGYSGSALEHQIWEDLIKLDSISTMKGLQWASERGIPIVTCTTTTCINGTLLSASLKTSLNSLISQGQEITVPNQELTGTNAYNQWSGYVYISRNPTNGGAGYIISGAFDGGSTTTTVVYNEPRFDLGGGANPASVTVSGDPVNVANGNLIHPETDFVIKSRGLDITWARTYNSQSTYNGPLGPGWTHSYNTHLVIDGAGNVTLRSSDGGEYFFTRTATGFTAPVGVYETLTLASGIYTLTHRDQSRQLFNSAGRLTEIRDTNGNRILLTYNASNQLSTISDPLNRNLTISYGANGKISQISDWSGRIWRYGYDASGRLTSYDNALNQRTTYSYYTGTYNNHNLYQVTDARNNRTTFAYYANDKVFWHTNGLGEKRLFSYNPFWQSTVEVDEVGDARTYDYDSAGNLIKLTEPTGGVLTYTWDSNRNMLTSGDGLGRITTYTYDAKGNIRRMTNPLGFYTDTQYHATFNKPTVIDRNGKITRMTYNATTGNLEQVTDPMGQITTYTYDAFGNLRTVTVPKPDNNTHPTNVTTYTYDANNLYITQVTNALGFITKYQYDTLGRMQWEEDPLLNRTTYTYDALDRVTQITDPDGNVSSMVYDAVGNVTSQTNARGFVTNYTYDAANRNTQITYPDGGIERMRYDGLGRMIARTDQRNNTWTYRYNGLNKVTQVVDPLGNTARSTYDAVGNLISSTDANGRTITVTYDRLNRQTRITDALNSQMQFQYDAWNNTTVITDTNLNVTRFVYDNLNRQIQVTDAEGQITSFGYDRLGHTSVITNAENQVIRFEYTVLGQLKRARDALNFTTVYTYDQAGRLSQMQDAKGQVTTYTYDKRARLTQRRFADNTTETYTYDPMNNITAANNAVVNLSYEYDSMNRLVRITDSRFTKSMMYGYDLAGNITSTIDPENRVTRYSYDAANRLVNQTLSDGIGVFYTFDPVGNRLERRLSNGFRTTYTYDALNRPTQVTNLNPAGATLASASYQYDKMSNVTQLVDQSGTTTYTYNKVYWLTNADYPGTTADESFTYYKQGNRRSRVSNGATTFYCYDAANRLTKLTGTDCTAAATTSFAYDANGNLTQQTQGTQTTTYSYNQRDQLTQVQYPTGSGLPNTVLNYDAHGNRVRRVDSTGEVRFFNDARAQVVAEYNGSNALLATYSHGPFLDEILHRRESTQTLYYLRDGMGSVSTIANGSGTEVARYYYNGYGSVRSSSGTGVDANRWRFAGRDQDRDSGLIYMRTRYYDPNLGRFLSKDTIGIAGGLNLYMYAANNPLKYVDLYGTSPNKWLDRIQGALDIVGFFDPTGIADGINAGIYAYRGDYVNAAISAASAIGGDALKVARYTSRAVDAAQDVGTVSRFVSNVCSFSEDTPVVTDTGEKPIADVKVGDKVLAYNEQTGTTGVYTVTDTTAHLDPVVVEVTIDGELIETTPEHPFYSTSRGGWVEAEDLRVGDKVRQVSGDSGTITAIEVEQREQMMYNLTVAVAHTFYVGDGGWLVHNACSLGRHGDLKRIRDGAQSHHLNQDAAFRSVIPREEGAAIKLRGNAFTERGSQHYEAHREMEAFWNQFRNGGTRSGEVPTIAEYNQALEQSLRSAGLSARDTYDAVSSATRQQARYGLNPTDPVPRIPGRINQR